MKCVLKFCLQTHVQVVEQISLNSFVRINRRKFVCLDGSLNNKQFFLVSKVTWGIARSQKCHKYESFSSQLKKNVLPSKDDITKDAKFYTLDEKSYVWHFTIQYNGESEHQLHLLHWSIAKEQSTILLTLPFICFFSFIK